MEDRRGVILCEICFERPATEIKGGIYNDKRDMWQVCKICKELIKDERKN